MILLTSLNRDCDTAAFGHLDLRLSTICTLMYTSHIHFPLCALLSHVTSVAIAYSTGKCPGCYDSAYEGTDDSKVN